MQKRFSVAVAAIAVFGLMSVFATSAMALPSYGTCSGCHSLNTSVKVAATQTSNNGATAAYHVTVSGPNADNGWAVYDGTTKVTYGSGTSGNFSVAVGKTYTVYGGNANGSSQLYNKVTISPVAPTPPPSGGTSGTPGATGTPDPTGTPVPVPTPSGKIVYKVHFNLHHHHYKGLKSMLQNKATGAKYYSVVNHNGNSVFKVPAGLYRLSTYGNSKYKFKAKTVSVGLSSEEDDD